MGHEKSLGTPTVYCQIATDLLLSLSRLTLHMCTDQTGVWPMDNNFKRDLILNKPNYGLQRSLPVSK